MSGARLIHLNGPPGIGKTTLARRYAAEHLGVLLCDIDVLRTMIGGWQDDDGAAGAGAHRGAGPGHRLPVHRVRRRAAPAGRSPRPAGPVHRRSARSRRRTRPRDARRPIRRPLVRRFQARVEAADDEWTSYATEFWAAEGGDAALLTVSARLDSLPAVRVPSTDPETTYRALLVALSEHV